MAGEEAIFANIPLYNPVILGNPTYVWLILIMGSLILLGVAAFKLEIYDRLEPVWGHRSASFNNVPEAIVHGMSGKIWLMPVDSIAGIFSAMGLPLKWIQTVPTQGQLGKVNVVEVSDDWNIVHNIDIDYAIVEAAHRWNAEWAKTHKPEDTGYIYDGETFMEKLTDGSLDQMFPSGIKLPPFRFVYMNEIRRYLPIWTASHHAGYIQDQIAKRLDDQDEVKKGQELLKYAIAAAGIMLISAVLAYFILHA